ncbi:MAG: flagellar motor switch protein FliN [Pseudomonadota bacterium]
MSEISDATENPLAIEPAITPFEEFALPGNRQDGRDHDMGHDPDSMEAVHDVPVKVQAVLGRSRMDIGALLKLRTGDILELDRRVGEPVDIFVNNRPIARGEIVLIDGAIGVTLTEIVKQAR